MADIPASNWNEADASNNSAAPDGMPEGMAPSGVNDTGRAMMGAIKRWYDWTIPKTAGGTSTAYTLAYSVAPGALVDGMSHMVLFTVAPGDAPTLNVNGLGARAIHYYSVGAWRAVPAGLWGANWIAPVTYNASAGTYRLIGFDNRTGTVEEFSGTTAPAGTVFAYGQAISRTAFVGLFIACGTAHGTGNGTTTFNVIDKRGRVGVGKDDMGGTPAGRMTASAGGINGLTLGAVGGAQTKTAATTISGTTSGSLTVAKGGPFADADGHSGTNLLYDASALSTTGNLTINIAGTSSAFAVVQPGVVANYVVRL